MRVFIAGLTVWGGTFALVAMFSDAGALKYVSPFVMSIVLGIGMVCLFLASFLFFTTRRQEFDPHEEARRIRDLKKKGLLVTVKYAAKRAFEVQEEEDLGMNFYVELDDGRTMFLSGQYLYEYEGGEGENGRKERRKFPCTSFTVTRHKTEGYLVDFKCTGKAFEPELMAGPFTEDDYKKGRIPEDGAIIADPDYDALKKAAGKRLPVVD